ncbi:MAG: thioredoxin family protein, partial [Candidatus Rokuibacteriota bacterium]
MVTAQRFAQGMTFEQYLAFIATPENLKREASSLAAGKREDRAPLLRQWYADARLSDAQAGAIKWLAAQPKGPAKVLVISEEWSSDCRRDVPVFQRMAEAGGMELRIFARDGQRFSAAPEPDPKESPNADLMSQCLNEKDGKTFQSLPVAAFYTRDFEHLYTY